MNIKQAKEYIKQTARMYLKKDDLGDYLIPVVRQRPIFMLGAPGVGKTAVMEQVAGELGIALVSYSMTHHTRQSAIGLPFIRRRTFGDMETDVTEYTMSEIISSMYETMEDTGIKEGILFLDEINCVSETLAPSMLQFLQYKVFGRHSVPEGWVIVTAGNPPEYNKAVREFDVAVLDRLKVIEVEPDYRSFKEYADERGIHPAIMYFLEMKKEYFYKIENTPKGRSYVTARGWEDLSEIISLYEQEGQKVDETLIDQYLRNAKVVREFAAYYDLYNKYKRDYRIHDILSGQAPESVAERAKAAAFDERLSLLSMLIDQMVSEMKDCVTKLDYTAKAAPVLKACEGKDKAEMMQLLTRSVAGMEEKLSKDKRAGAIEREEENLQKHAIRLLEEIKREALEGDYDYDGLKESYNSRLLGQKTTAREIGQKLTNLFEFVEKAFSEGNEMLILVTNLTVNPYSSRFIARFKCEAYEKHQGQLMLNERRQDMQQEIREVLEDSAKS